MSSSSFICFDWYTGGEACTPRSIRNRAAFPSLGFVNVFHHLSFIQTSFSLMYFQEALHTIFAVVNNPWIGPSFENDYCQPSC